MATTAPPRTVVPSLRPVRDAVDQAASLRGLISQLPEIAHGELVKLALGFHRQPQFLH